MAIAGTPDGKQEYDADMAAAYLRLMAYVNRLDEDAPDYLSEGFHSSRVGDEETA